jgi:hypothetical protein
MKALTDYPTPETDALVHDPSQVCGIVKPGFSEWCDHARSLERRLELAREMLDRIAPDDHTWRVMGTLSPRDVRIVIAATAPKP